MLTAKSSVVLMARLQARKVRLTKKKDRIAQLKIHPELLTEDDLEMLVDSQPRECRWLFIEQPEIKRRYQEYRDTPEQTTADLITFVRRAWPHARIGKTFQDNWHQHVFSRVIGRMSDREIMRALFSVPPGTGKSLWHGVFKPAWRWAIDPTERLAYFSYSDVVPGQTRDALSTLLHSSWYQRRWGHRFQIEKDGKEWITTSRGGWRFGQGVGGGGTGAHPDWLDIDDANKGRDANSQAKLKDVIKWFSNTVASRGAGNDCRITCTAQRIATNDLIGRILGEHLGMVVEEQQEEIEGLDDYTWHNVCLPMRFRHNHRYRYPLDPRTTDGELLWPERFDLKKVARMEREMSLSGEPNVQAQMDQDPMSSQSTLFENIDGMWIKPEDLPPKLSQCRAVRSWDRAGTENGGDWTVGVLIVQSGDRRYVLDVVRIQKEPTSRDNLIERVALQDRKRFEFYRVVNERMMGPDGKQVHTNLFITLQRHGIECVAQDPTKEKSIRARGVAASIKYGQTRFVDGKPWREAVWDELRLFPNGANDDIVDSLAHGYNALNEWETKV